LSFPYHKTLKIFGEVRW